MKAILEFTLPEEQEDFRDATDGWRCRAALDQMYSELRGHRKYGVHSCVRIDRVWDRFFEILDEWEVKIL